MKLTTKARGSLPKSDFAGPGRSYPVPDASHAANAKARATQAVNAGRMSKGTEAKIDAKANRKLGSAASTVTHGKSSNNSEKSKAPKGHEHLGTSKHFGGSGMQASGGGATDGLADYAKSKRFIGG